MADKLGFMTVSKLQEECAKLKLPIDGDKTELIERIRKFLNSTDSDTDGSDGDDGEKDEADVVVELTDEELTEFLLDKNDDKKTVTCKLCLDDFNLEEKDTTEHIKSKNHKTKFAVYKKAVEEKGNMLLEVYPVCEYCKREIPYPQWSYHQDTPRHVLNILLIENSQDPVSLPFSLIQKEVDILNTLENPTIGINYIHEIIYAEAYENYSVVYICKCCNIRESDKRDSDFMLKHITTKKHISNAVKKDHIEAYSAVVCSVDVFNKSRPAGAKNRHVNDELVHYINDNPSQFVKRHRIKVKIYLGDEYEKTIKEKYGLAKLKAKKMEDDPDVKAKIQERLNCTKRPVVGAKFLSERQYLSGEDVEFFCFLCHEELGGNEKPAIDHFCSLSHKKRYLHRCQTDIYKEVEEHNKYIPNATKKQLREREQIVNSLVKKLAAAFVDKYPRPQVNVVLKSGKSSPALKLAGKKQEMKERRRAKEENWARSNEYYGRDNWNYGYNDCYTYYGGYGCDGRGYRDQYGYNNVAGGYDNYNYGSRQGGPQHGYTYSSSSGGGYGNGPVGSYTQLARENSSFSAQSEHYGNQAMGNNYVDDLNPMEYAMIHKLSKVITKQVMEARRGQQDESNNVYQGNQGSTSRRGRNY